MRPITSSRTSLPKRRLTMSIGIFPGRKPGILAWREYSLNDLSNSSVTCSPGISTSSPRLQPSSSLTTTFIKAKPLGSQSPFACWGNDPGMEPGRYGKLFLS